MQVQAAMEEEPPSKRARMQVQAAMEEEPPSSSVPSWARYEYEHGIPQGDLTPPERLNFVQWDRTAYNRGQLVKLARIYFRLDYEPKIDTDMLAQKVHAYCSDWDKQNKGVQTW